MWYVIEKFFIYWTEIGIQFALLYRPNSLQLPNAALNVYSSRICFHPLNHNHVTKEASVCHSIPVFLHAHLIHDSMQCPAGTQPNHQPAICQNASKCIFHVKNVLYKQVLSCAIHHTFNVSLLQENVTHCCDLLKHSTFPFATVTSTKSEFTKKI